MLILGNKVFNWGEMNLISNYSDINYENAEFANVNFEFWNKTYDCYDFLQRVFSYNTEYEKWHDFLKHISNSGVEGFWIHYRNLH